MHCDVPPHFSPYFSPFHSFFMFPMNDSLLFQSQSLLPLCSSACKLLGTETEESKVIYFMMQLISVLSRPLPILTTPVWLLYVWWAVIPLSFLAFFSFTCTSALFLSPSVFFLQSCTFGKYFILNSVLPWSAADVSRYLHVLLIH